MTDAIMTRQVRGHGRGKLLGYPTINMEIPPGMSLTHGIYAAWVTMGGVTFRGAVHYGPVPAFGQKEVSFEVFLLVASESELNGLDTSQIRIKPVTRIREVRAFGSSVELVDQITKDVEAVRSHLSGVMP